MGDNSLMGLVVDVGKILLHHIEHVGRYGDLLITYGDVTKQLPYEFNPRNLDQPLGILSEDCSELGLPLISTIVVNQDEMMPGAGYFKTFFSGIKASQRPDIFMEQYSRVKACHNWAPLERKLGLK